MPFLLAFVVVAWMLALDVLAASSLASRSKPRPNVIVIVADDMGYADSSVAEFSGNGIKTPELEKMAKNGLVMTNFHSAAPVCSPARASIMTGLFPWRLGIYSVFGSGPQSKSHLAVTINAPIIFGRAGYYTGESSRMQCDAQVFNQ